MNARNGVIEEKFFSASWESVQRRARAMPPAARGEKRNDAYRLPEQIDPITGTFPEERNSRSYGGQWARLAEVAVLVSRVRRWSP